MLTRDASLAADDLPREKVLIPEWANGIPPEESFLFIRGLTAKEGDAFELAHNEARKSKKPANYRAGIVARAACDENGKRIYEDKDAEALGNKSRLVLDRLYDVAARLSGYGKKEEEELEKNSDSQGDGSSSV